MEGYYKPFEIFAVLSDRRFVQDEKEVFSRSLREFPCEFKPLRFASRKLIPVLL